MNRIWNGALWRALAVGICLGVVAAPSRAADAWYEVEVIVFAQHHPDAGNEVFPENPGSPNLNNVFEIPTVATKDAQLRPLPADQFRLKSEEEKLLGSDKYEVLLHTGWRQPGLMKEQAIPVHLHTPVPVVTSENGIAAAQPTPPRLDGVVNLSLARYLHLDVDLLYRSADAPSGDSGFFGSSAPTAPLAYRMQESRRMRSKELHYLDHPMFGVIALVTPYDPQQAAADAAPTVAAVPQPAANQNTTSGTIRRN